MKLGLPQNSRITRLFALRWSGQLTDGIFQSGLASFILFSPERQSDALAAAAAFAIVLLPYSIVGPFVGTILDRFSRQRILLYSNSARAVIASLVALLIWQGATGFWMVALVLVAFGVNRLILAGLSASLPLLVAQDAKTRERLVAINATAVTGGTVFVVLGGGVGIGVRNLMTDFSANHADSLVILLAGTGFLVTALLALLLRKEELGPAADEFKKASFTAGINEMRDGFRRLNACRDAMLGIIATGVHRGGLTALTLMALILQRNSFNSSNEPNAGLAGFALAAVVAGVGIAIGALVAPFGVARFGRHRWIRWMLIASAIAPVFLALEQSESILLFTGFLTGACGQGVKVTNDALVQSQIIDQYRGRVFAVYDVMVNFAIVSGAIVAALLLPTSGAGGLLPLVVAISYLVVAIALLRPKYFHSNATS